MDENERREIALDKVKNDATYKEMKRMKIQSPFLNRFKFTEAEFGETNRDHYTMCVHMPQSHLSSIKSDYGMMNADVLVFVETAVQTCDQSQALPTNHWSYYKQYHIDGYTLIKMGSSGEQGSKCGCAVYQSNRRLPANFIQFIGDNSPNGDGVYGTAGSSSNICELGLFVLRNEAGRQVRVIYAYNHPSLSMKNMYNELKVFMRKHNLLDELDHPISQSRKIV